MQVWGDAIVASVTVQPPEQPSLVPEGKGAIAPKSAMQAQLSDKGAFALAVSPPAPDVALCFPRSVVFLIDRSGSMQGGMQLTDLTCCAAL
jgi:hypothetical protein